MDWHTDFIWDLQIDEQFVSCQPFYAFFHISISIFKMIYDPQKKQPFLPSFDLSPSNRAYVCSPYDCNLYAYLIWLFGKSVKAKNKIITAQIHIFMKYQNNKKTIEDFISYKLENSYESESSRNAFKLQKKYQKILDLTVQNIVAKQHQVHILNLQYKKTKEKVWQKMLDISNAIKSYEDESYLYMSKMREITQDRENRDREIERKRREIKNRENSFIEQIETIEEQSQYYFGQKKQDIANLKKQSVQIKGKIAEYEPLVHKFYDTLIMKQSLLQNIDSTRKSIQNQVKNLWEISQQLQSLQKEKKEKLKEKEQAQKTDIVNRKKLINEFIESINECIESASDLEDEEKQKIKIQKILASIEQRKKKYTDLEKGQNQLPTSQVDFINSDRFVRITNLMGVSVNGQTKKQQQQAPSTPLSPNKKSKTALEPILSVNQQSSQTIRANIAKLEQRIIDTEMQRITLKEKQDEVDIIQNEKDKQIKNLTSTLQKMKISLQGK